MKIESAIKKAYINLRQNNIKTALLDSELLMSKVLKKERSNIILNPKKLLKKQDYKNFRKLIKGRLRNKPIAYLTGVKSFCLKFRQRNTVIDMNCIWFES